MSYPGQAYTDRVVLLKPAEEPIAEENVEMVGIRQAAALYKIFPPFIKALILGIPTAKLLLARLQIPAVHTCVRHEFPLPAPAP